jgi:hypothetical protein
MTGLSAVATARKKPPAAGNTDPDALQRILGVLAEDMTASDRPDVLEGDVVGSWEDLDLAMQGSATPHQCVLIIIRAKARGKPPIVELVCASSTGLALGSVLDSLNGDSE